MGIKVRAMIREANTYFASSVDGVGVAAIWRVLRALERRTRRLEAQVETDREWASQDIDDLRTRVAVLEVAAKPKAEPPAEPVKFVEKTLGQIAFEADGDDGWSTLSTRCRNSWELFAKAAVAADRERRNCKCPHQ